MGGWSGKKISIGQHGTKKKTGQGFMGLEKIGIEKGENKKMTLQNATGIFLSFRGWGEKAQKATGRK